MRAKDSTLKRRNGNSKRLLYQKFFVTKFNKAEYFDGLLQSVIIPVVERKDLSLFHALITTSTPLLRNISSTFALSSWLSSRTENMKGALRPMKYTATL